jgi:hypothetical protein
MVVAKSRLKKVRNVRKKLHNPTGSFSQRVRTLGSTALSKIKNFIKKPVSKKSVQSAAVNAVQQLQRKVTSKKAVQSGAVEAVRQLQRKVTPTAPLKPTLPQKLPPPITSPSPASIAYKLKGPSRPPPPPPSTIPSRPIMNKPKVAPAVPMKPLALRGRRIK